MRGRGPTPERELGEPAPGREVGEPAPGREFGDPAPGREFGEPALGREFGERREYDDWGACHGEKKLFCEPGDEDIMRDCPGRGKAIVHRWAVQLRPLPKRSQHWLQTVNIEIQTMVIFGLSQYAVE